MLFSSWDFYFEFSTLRSIPTNAMLCCTARWRWPGVGRAGPSQGLEAELLPRMLDHTIRTYFPDIWRAHLGDTLQARHHSQPCLICECNACGGHTRSA